MNLYADDAKIFREIKNLEDCEILQSDLNAIISFLSNWQLKFNVEKCVSVKLMRSRGRRNYAYDYKINGVILKASSCEKDLGVYVSTHPIHGLSFSKHISTICSKARKTCYLIHHFFSTRNTSFKMRLFNTYVRPLLEYASTVWNPFLVKDIDLLENVQRSFTKRLCGMKNYSYKRRLQVLNSEPLEIRRIKADLIEVYKVFHQLDCLQFEKFFKLSSRVSRHGHLNNLQVQRFDKEIFKNFWSNRVVKIWNALPSEVVLSENIRIFKSRLLSINLNMYLKGSIRLELGH